MNTDQQENRNLSNDELVELLRASAFGDTALADDFFGRFNYVQELVNGNFSTALDLGISLLLQCRSLDENAYTTIHKGTPFYWLGTAAFMVHDHETATFFFDASVSEDIRAGADPINNVTPALRFIQIEGNQPNQAAQGLVLASQARVDDLLNQYNNMTGRPANMADLTLNDLRQTFLQPAVSPDHKGWRSIATTFISFVLEWDYRNAMLDLRTNAGTSEPFFMHLFKGCVLFESLLKANPNHQLPPNANTLGPVLQNLHAELNIPHNMPIGQSNLPDIIRDLGNADNNIRTAVEFTGRLRNSVGHNIGWNVNIGKIQYQRLFQMVAASCFHSIACLYR